MAPQQGPEPTAPLPLGFDGDTNTNYAADTEKFMVQVCAED